MPSFRLLPFLGLLALSTTCVLAERGNPLVEFEGQSVDRMISDFMREHEVPGMTLAIVQAPYITRVTGYGLSDPHRKLLASTNTLFPVAQMAEAYTAVAILQLVESGKIKLDDPIGNYVPNLPASWRTIPLRDLVRHTSGLPSTGQQPPAFEPGSATAPSATDYRLLQTVIEKASGQSYQQFVRANQFDRLGLRHTFFASELAQVHSETFPTGGRHAEFLKKPDLINPLEVAVSSIPPKTKPLPTAIYTSALDVSLWDVGLAGEILIKNPELRKILYTPGTLKNGTKLTTSGPWSFPGRPGLMLVSGSGDGASAFLSRYTHPDELLCVTLLANKQGLDLAPLAARIAAAFDARLIHTSAIKGRDK